MKKLELPEGLGFGLAMNEKAMSRFSNMTDEEKTQVIEAARSVQSKEQMKGIIRDIEEADRYR